MNDERDPIRDWLITAILEAAGGPTEDERWEAENLADDLMETEAWKHLMSAVKD